MAGRFFERPILNSPYAYPSRHWELDARGQPTDRIAAGRRRVSFLAPIPKPRKRGRGQRAIVFDEAAERISDGDRQYDLADLIGGVRRAVDAWRSLPEEQWRVTPETARLLRHWRSHRFAGLRPFFCQVEAAETAIWLTEAAPRAAAGRRIVERLEAASAEANPGLSRLALKLATGAGKTTVMAMLIAWQTVNAVRRPNSRRFARGFLVTTPGIAIRDRLRVLMPNDPDSYYGRRELVPADMLGDLERARIVITNFHAYARRETAAPTKVGRALLRGRGPELRAPETDGQMLRRVMPELMGAGSVLAINDEAHHCYREKPGGSDEAAAQGDDRREAEANRAAARLWISGLEAAARTVGLSRVVDLSATPFFLRGSGYAEGTLFPWTASDFSLMDAIECGVVKLPRVPVSDNVVARGDMPKYRDLWTHIGKKMPKGGRGAAGGLDPLALPVELQTALDALYGHYERTFAAWSEAGIAAPPCFIIVCNNMAASKLVYDYVSGFRRARPGGGAELHNGRLPLFRNFADDGAPFGRPRTLLIDSARLESGEALHKDFRAAAADEIARFRREIVKRTGDRARAEAISDEDLLREVLNTVGKPDRLGGSIRCVVSVSMLTEGWDANTVTHILGVRAFGTQLLCEQVVGRALRRQSYELNADGLLDAEYADVLGVPFDFTATPTVVPPPQPRKVTQVRAVSPERDACAIRFPRVAGYRVEPPRERLEARFGADSTLELTPEDVGPAVTRNEGVVGAGATLTLAHLESARLPTLAFHLAKRLLETKWSGAGGAPKPHLFGQLKRIALRWLDAHLLCRGGTRPAQLRYPELMDRACERIHAGIVARHMGENPVAAVLDAWNPEGSTAGVRFATSKPVWRTAAHRCHVDWAVCDSEWEAEFCRVAEAHPRVLAYVKNQGLGFEVPYRAGSESRVYLPDFIVRADDGRGAADPLHLVVEVKGRRGEDEKDKRTALETYWLPGVNALGGFGRWAFAEFRDPYAMEEEFAAAVEAAFADMLAPFLTGAAGAARSAPGRGGAAAEAARVMDQLKGKLRVGSRLTREQMNER